MNQNNNIYTVANFKHEADAKGFLRFFPQFPNLKKVPQENGSVSIVFEGSKMDRAMFTDNLSRQDPEAIDKLLETKAISKVVADNMQSSRKKALEQIVGSSQNTVLTIESTNNDIPEPQPTKALQDIQPKKVLPSFDIQSGIIGLLELHQKGLDIDKQITDIEKQIDSLKQQHQTLGELRSETQNLINRSGKLIIDTLPDKQNKFVVTVYGSKYLVNVGSQVEVEKIYEI